MVEKTIELLVLYQRGEMVGNPATQGRSEADFMNVQFR
jgi:hypothetical protein